MSTSDLDQLVARALGAGVLSEEEPAAVVYDLAALDGRLRALGEAFRGARALHALAAKACPISAILRRAVRAGFGLEVASEVELALAARVGAAPDRVVFDSPAKTRAEIEAAIGRGVRLNVDNLAELARIGDARGAASVGLRLNPGLAGGSARIAHTFTGARGSKFGVDLHAERAAVLEAFARTPWLRGVHVHAGSQGVPLEVLVRAVVEIVRFAEGIPSVEVIDVGGGLPVRYAEGDPAPTFVEYAAALRAEVPELFDGRRLLITEMGRSVFGPCAVALSHVEYVRPGRTAVLHLGADMFLRAAYRPEDWRHEVVVFDHTGARKDGPREPWSLAGPLCFSGDFVARDRPLPTMEPGDVVAILDAGAYTLSMWSRYNSRRAPAAWGIEADGTAALLKPRESVDDVLRFWGA